MLLIFDAVNETFEFLKLYHALYDLIFALLPTFREADDLLLATAIDC